MSNNKEFSLILEKGKINNPYVTIKNISFNLHKNKCIFLIAKNASGKSSLFKSIFKYKSYKLEYDKFFFKNEENMIFNMNDLTNNDLAEFGFFLSFQQPIIISELKTKDFLYLIYKNENKNLEETILQENFNKIINDFFDNLNIDKKILDYGLYENFSGGEHKKIEFLQCILLKSKLLFLDEIETGLDENSRK